MKASILLLLSTSVLLAEEPQPDTVVKSGLVADFKTPIGSLEWESVNDGVMGGISKGKFTLDQKAAHLTFQGTISLENNGGFSSIRTFNSKHDFSGFTGYKIRLKGDGRKYYFTSRHKLGRGAYAFWHPVQTVKNQWQIVELPFTDFYATWFGKKVPSTGLKTDAVTSIGVMMYDKEAGPFQLKIDWVKVVKKVK